MRAAAVFSRWHGVAAVRRKGERWRRRTLPAEKPPVHRQAQVAGYSLRFARRSSDPPRWNGIVGPLGDGRAEPVWLGGVQVVLRRCLKRASSWLPGFSPVGGQLVAGRAFASPAESPILEACLPHTHRCMSCHLTGPGSFSLAPASAVRTSHARCGAGDGGLWRPLASSVAQRGNVVLVAPFRSCALSAPVLLGPDEKDRNPTKVLQATPKLAKLFVYSV